MQHSLIPKFFTTIREYTREQFIKDFIAGIIVGIIAIPLSIALGIASFPPEVAKGMAFSPAESGLYTAIIAGFLISLLGGSRVQIGGPTGAFVVIVYGIINTYGYDGLVIATIMAGIFLIIMGMTRMGSLIKYIPYPVTCGFTSGIAIVLCITQLKEFLGMKYSEIPEGSLGKVEAAFNHFGSSDLATVTIGLLALAIIVFWPEIPGKITKIIPGSLIAIIVTTLLVKFLPFASFHDVATIGDRFSDLKAQLPPFHIPVVPWENLRNLVAPALTIALLAGIESLLSAVVADGMTGSRHRSNAELIAQGAANVGSAFFGGLPATGAIARTAANVRNGGRTPVAGMIHAATVLAIMLIFMPYAKMIPMTTLAAILLVVCYNMGDWQVFRDMLKAPRSDLAVLLVTCALTILVDLVVAIEVSMIITAFLFMKRMADVTEVNVISDDEEGADEDADIRRALARQYGQKIQIYEIRGPFFFGAADKFMAMLNQMHDDTRVIIVKLEHVPAMDATALHFLDTLHTTCRKRNIGLYLTHVASQPMRVIRKSDFFEDLGADHFYPDLETAVLAVCWQLD
jgi:SulP family sulfate permease